MMTVASIGSWLLTYLVHSTIIIGGVYLWSRRSRAGAATRDRMWRLALVGGLLTATAQVGLGIAPMSGRIDLGDHVVPPAPVPAPALSHEAAPVLAASPLPQAAPVRAAPIAVSDTQPIDTQPMAVPWLPPSDPAGSATPAAATWLASGALAWLSIAFLALAGLAVGAARVRGRLGERRPVGGGPRRLLDRLLLAADHDGAVALTASDRAPVPMAFGLRRPEICVPERALGRLERREQEAMLAHELAHVVRRDPAWRLLAAAIERIFFIQPLNRLAAARMREASELACDDWAVERTRQPLALARCLTEVAGWSVRRDLGPVAAMAGGGELGARVRRLIGDRPAAGGGRAPLLIGGFALVALVAAAPTASIAHPHPDDDVEVELDVTVDVGDGPIHATPVDDAWEWHQDDDGDWAWHGDAEPERADKDRRRAHRRAARDRARALKQAAKARKRALKQAAKARKRALKQARRQLQAHGIDPDEIERELREVEREVARELERAQREVERDVAEAMREAQEEMREAQEEMREAEQERREAKQEAMEEWHESQRGVQEMQRQMQDAARRIQEAQREMQDAQRELQRMQQQLQQRYRHQHQGAAPHPHPHPAPDVDVDVDPDFDFDFDFDFEDLEDLKQLEQLEHLDQLDQLEQFELYFGDGAAPAVPPVPPVPAVPSAAPVAPVDPYAGQTLPM